MDNIALLLLVTILTLPFMFARRARYFLSYAFLTATYFLISTEFFTFGENIPIFGYSRLLRQEYAGTILLIYACFIFALLGNWAGSRLGPKRRDVGLGFKQASIVLGKKNSARVLLKHYLLVFLSLLPVLFISFAIDLADFWQRTYSFDPAYSNPRMMAFADLSFWIAAICIPFVRPRGFSLLLLFALVVAFAGLGERHAPVGIFVYVIISLLFRRNFGLLANCGLAAFGVYLLTVLIGVRSSQVGGIYMIYRAFISPASFLPDGAFAYAINYMLNFSVVVNTLASLEGRHFSRDLVLYGISPLPSFIFDMTEQFDGRTRMLPYVPFPGFAMLYGAFGLPFFVSFSFAFFFVLEIVMRFIFRLRGALDQVLFLLVLYIPLLFSFQYNLRAASRILFILVGAYIGYALVVNRKRFRVRA
jgi:hypothetical protein